MKKSTSSNGKLLENISCGVIANVGNANVLPNISLVIPVTIGYNTSTPLQNTQVAAAPSTTLKATGIIGTAAVPPEPTIAATERAAPTPIATTPPIFIPQAQILFFFSVSSSSIFIITSYSSSLGKIILCTKVIVPSPNVTNNDIIGLSNLPPKLPALTFLGKKKLKIFIIKNIITSFLNKVLL